MLWEHEPQASDSTAFSSPPSFTSVPITGVLDRNTYNMFLFLLENTVAQKTKRTCLHSSSKCKFSLLTPSLRQQLMLVLCFSTELSKHCLNQSACVFALGSFLIGNGNGK